MTDAPDLDTWFVREILGCEASLTRYLARTWPSANDIPDIIQEAYIRVLEAAVIERPAHPKSFLFQTTRNLLSDRARRARIVAIDVMEDLESLNVLVDELTPERRTSARQQLTTVAMAFNAMPDRCRDVVWMKRVQNLSHKEIAERLGIEVSTVEKHLAKGIRLLTEQFGRDDSAGSAEEPKRKSRHETNHGD
jgi:RNA polymerase sigma-70 factor (ECF subfamily)